MAVLCGANLMLPTHETSDDGLLDLLRKHGALSVAQLAGETQVTATAVRQRLTRLLAGGDIERTTEKSGRGRPVHRYEITEKGRRKSGNNFGDLAIALWDEVRHIKDPEVRRGLLSRISSRLAGSYAAEVRGSNLKEKMESLAKAFSDRRMPFEVDTTKELPVLAVTACPYPDLAERDRSICSMEKMMFSELLGESVHLSNCRLDGGGCCTFESAKVVETVG
jgi:DeoR family transcriptional regulator, suf operon transcriptional repressor